MFESIIKNDIQLLLVRKLYRNFWPKEVITFYELRFFSVILYAYNAKQFSFNK
jgi:hypothetical protein